MLSAARASTLARSALRPSAPTLLRTLPQPARALHSVSPLFQQQQQQQQLKAKEGVDQGGRPEPTRSFQPHFKDTTSSSPPSLPSASASPEAVQAWHSSRPHEDWVAHHPVYTDKELDSIQMVYLPPKTMGDKLAHFMVWFARKGFDFVSGYKHADPAAARAAAVKDGKGDLSLDDLRKQGYIMTEEQWMARILFLESIAGVPGFTAGILRHLRSLRLMKRDGGWINSLLQEAENERMHLLTFMKIRDPSPFFRLLVLGAQGVFFNFFFVAYLLSPRAAHRFVGYLEEQAVTTYSHIVDAIQRGEIPEWDSNNPASKKVPQVAKDYWRLDDAATMLDLIKAVRADEAGHRFVNHTLANLQKDDFNPVAFKHASPETQGTLPGFSRDESLAYARKVQEELTGKEVREGEKKEQ